MDHPTGGKNECDIKVVEKSTFFGYSVADPRFSFGGGVPIPKWVY